MDPFDEKLILRAATIDELLSDNFEPLPGQKGNVELAAQRLAAWCRSSASGDWSLFGQRLDRDQLSILEVLKKFATVRRNTTISPPAWVDDAIWIEAALQSRSENETLDPELGRTEPCAFEQLFATVVEQAEIRLWSGIDARAIDRLNETARACLRFSLLKQLSRLSSPAIYQRFVKARTTSGTPSDAKEPQHEAAKTYYNQFVDNMKAGGFRLMFEDKPVLLRLIASTTRQWIDTSREFIIRLDADLAIIRRHILNSDSDSRVAKIESDLSDTHNNGRSVLIVSFEDGSRVVYKPKDLQLDAAWYSLIERLNRAEAPVDLKAVYAIPREGYGWTEFIDHIGCADQRGYKRFFERAGAWLALFHCFVATDMHQENVIASADHPVPIDLEMILQATADELKTQEPEGLAFEAAMEAVANSVMVVGLLPSYGRSQNNDVFVIGGMTSNWNSTVRLTWTNINSDNMRPAKSKDARQTTPNLPHVDGSYAKFGEHIDTFIAGFGDYAEFLLNHTRNAGLEVLLAGFSGLSVRKVVRPTRFYYMLLERLKNHQSMGDGVLWSVQADFLARLANLEKIADPLWSLQRAERSALLTLNVPHFTLLSDGREIEDASGIVFRTDAISGLDRACERIRGFDEQEIAWQIEIIRQNTGAISKSLETRPDAVERNVLLFSERGIVPTNKILIAEADNVATELSKRAIRRGSSAAWVGLDWLVNSEFFQLVCLGPELYNGVSGIAIFLAAHAAVTGCEPSAELALAAISYLRKNLKSRNAARMARSLGIGGASGLGSIVYALTTISKFLHDNELLADALGAAELFTDDLIAADKQLDVVGGSAGAILCLLRLYRDSKAPKVLNRATMCGEHLIGQQRHGRDGRRSWVAQGFGLRALNGISHGAAGFAYALTSLAAVTGREDFAGAASECVAFENSSYDAERKNWPDLRMDTESAWPCQWCHGAPGIGLARIGMTQRAGLGATQMTTDVRNAIESTRESWPGHVDTLCCGTLGGIEFLCEAATTFMRDDLRELALRRLGAVLERAAQTGDYRWNTGEKQFNLGLFRGVAGVGYTLLRRVENSLPNILIWG